MEDVLKGEAFSGAEIVALRQLLEIEEVRKVMLLYAHLMDSRDWDAMAQLYTEDAVGEWGPYGTWHGRAQIHRQLVDGHLGRLPYDGFHCITNVWAELTGPRTAVSRCYLTDVWPSDVTGPISHAGYPQNPVLIYAIYDNDYVKNASGWQIARSRIAVIWPERIVPEAFPRDLAALAG